MAARQKYLSGSTVCSVDGCNRLVAAHDFCQGHYKRFSKNGDAGDPEFAIRAAQANTCTIDGCDRPPVARGWCKGPYSRWLSSGEPGPAFQNPVKRLPRSWEIARVTEAKPAEPRSMQQSPEPGITLHRP